MPIIYVSTFFVGLIIYMAIFLILMKVRADLLAALMDNIEKKYPFFIVKIVRQCRGLEAEECSFPIFMKVDM